MLPFLLYLAFFTIWSNILEDQVIYDKNSVIVVGTDSDGIAIA